MKKKIEVTPWDTSEILHTEEDCAGYLAAAFEDGDPAIIRAAMADVAKARNMTQLAKEMGISRRGLYKMLYSEGNPEFLTIQKFIAAVNAKLTVVGADNKHKTRSKIRKAK